MKLLIIDSDRDFVEMLTGWLTTLGYAVHRAFNSEQAMREWDEHQPELIILAFSSALREWAIHWNTGPWTSRHPRR